MLLNLVIQDFVLIRKLSLDFKKGLVVLTGETGAGKSIILDAVNLILGSRADKGLIRNGAEKAIITASFNLDPEHYVFSLLKEKEYQINLSDNLILKRIITMDGRSKALINDQPASLSILKMISETMIEIHGQHDGTGLLNAKNHQIWLDSFGKKQFKSYLEIVEKTEKEYQSLMIAKQKLDRLKKQISEINQERDYILQSMDVLEKLGYELGEEEKLTKERALLNQSEKIISELNEINMLLDFEKGCESILSEITGKIEACMDGIKDQESNLYQALQSAAQSSEQALIELREALGQLDQAQRALVFEPEYLDQIEERLFAIRDQARKHNITPDELVSLLESLKEKRDEYEQSDDSLEKRQSDYQISEQNYQFSACQLTEIRIKAAKLLNNAIMQEFKPLKLDKARFRTCVQADPNILGRKGRDHILFEISTNPGQPFGNLAIIASGGELSRFALAMKVVIAEHKAIMIFDEIDQGVGGAVASSIGRRLKKLSKGNQVFVVTHSPQIAAFADQHYSIQKRIIKDQETQTFAMELNKEEHFEELARMLSGDKITHEARAAAIRLTQENRI